MVVMMYISKYDTKFITFMNKKYKKFGVKFEFYDDYILWLFYDYFKGNEKEYYVQLEKDLGEYSDFQTGKERDNRGRLSGDMID